MYDLFSFPRILGDTPEKQVAEVVDYLIQFKETLEFALTNIGTENLSHDLVAKINKLGAGDSSTSSEETLSQLSRGTLTIYDVVNSDLFASMLESKVLKVDFSVNFETGELEYKIKE